MHLEDLFQWWADIAWAVHTARSEKRVLLELELIKIIGHQEDSPAFRATASLLHLSRSGVRGYFHEVFQEYWLAYYLTQRILSELDAKQLVGLLMYQRSVVTNRLLKLGLRKNDVSRVARRLRDAYWSAELALTRTVFVKNELVYLLGRIDGDGAETRRFLRSVWASDVNAVIPAFSCIRVNYGR